MPRFWRSLSCVAPALGCVLAAAPWAQAQSSTSSTTHHKPSAADTTHSSTKSTTKSSKAHKNSHGSASVSHSHAVASTTESRRLSSAFTASAQLRPMAQQLAATRSASAYSGVMSYASSHPGEGAAAAELAVGHAYSLDRRYGDAESAFHEASLQGIALADYSAFLGAQAAVQANRPTDALPLLDHFAERFPDSIFLSNAPILQANAYLAAKNPGAAISVLVSLQATVTGRRTDFRATLAKAYQATGNSSQAVVLYRGIYLGDPISAEAQEAKKQLLAMNAPLSAGEQKQHADALFNAKHYEQAELEYRAIQHESNGLSQADHDALEIYVAVCELRLKKLSKSDVEHLPITNDDSAALKLYLQSELARNANDFAKHDALVAELTDKYPQARWLEEALYSGGNMYLLKHDALHAIADYTLLTQHFPHSIYSPTAHWRAAWLNYRLRRYPDAARLMDEQILLFREGSDVPGAMYWRGRMYEDVENNLGQALNYYDALNARYPNTYYAILGRVRMAALGARQRPAPAAPLATQKPAAPPDLTDVLPENDTHLIKARLLANAALNEYIGPEIQASPTSSQWGALAQAEIYSSFGETTRALQMMKKSGLPFSSTPVNEIPRLYWALLFPKPYWDEIVANSKVNSLDPYLVASLIRQESEFNPGAVSRANAYGLMQLLPSTGKSEGKKIGIKNVTTTSLLNPTVNIELGTADLKRSLDRYSGQAEYALAAYNAGDGPVKTWIAEGDYKDIPEWVESIPFTETREYVQGILRYREMYRAIYSGQ